MSGIDCERVPRQSFGPEILAILFEAERVHREHARIAWHSGVPYGQHLRGAIPQHPPLPESEVERMSRRKRKHVFGVVDDDGAVAFRREYRISVQPGACRVSVAPCAIVRLQTSRLDYGETRGEPRASGLRVSMHDDSGLKAVARYAVRVIGQNTVDLGERIATMRKHELEHLVATRLQIRQRTARPFPGIDFLRRS